MYRKGREEGPPKKKEEKKDKIASLPKKRGCGGLNRGAKKGGKEKQEKGLGGEEVFSFLPSYLDKNRRRKKTRRCL